MEESLQDKRSKRDGSNFRCARFSRLTAARPPDGSPVLARWKRGKKKKKGGGGGRGGGSRTNILAAPQVSRRLVRLVKVSHLGKKRVKGGEKGEGEHLQLNPLLFAEYYLLKGAISGFGKKKKKKGRGKEREIGCWFTIRGGRVTHYLAIPPPRAKRLKNGERKKGEGRAGSRCAITNLSLPMIAVPRHQAKGGGEKKKSKNVKIFGSSCPLTASRSSRFSARKKKRRGEGKRKKERKRSVLGTPAFHCARQSQGKTASEKRGETRCVFFKKYQMRGEATSPLRKIS